MGMHLTGWFLLSMAISSVAFGAEPQPLAAVEQYLEAVRSAGSNKDLSRFHSKRRKLADAKTLKKVQAKPDRQVREAELALLEMEYKFVKMLDLRDPTLVSSGKEGARTKLELTLTQAALDNPSKRIPLRGWVWLVRERGVWKIDEERWAATFPIPPDSATASAPPTTTAPPTPTAAPAAPDPGGPIDIPLEPSMRAVEMGDFAAEAIYPMTEDVGSCLAFADPFHFERHKGTVPAHRVRKYESKQDPRRIYLFYKNKRLLESDVWASSYFHFDVQNEADQPDICSGRADAVFYRMMQNGGGRTVDIVAIRPTAKARTQVFVFTYAEQ